MEGVERRHDRPAVGGSEQTTALQIELEPVPRASAQARSALAAFAERLPASSYSDLRVIITELITNGVKYGPGRSIRVDVALDTAGFLHGCVDDGGSGGLRMKPSLDPPRAGGLGLRIVDSLTSAWGVHPGSSQVWFELDASTP
ncbi:MAG: serine/threonine-protein kinase RsbW [Solirubrobacterales bacterium]|jgi:anti-sigma regulatory factor (Ser/Thr protein kinase)|nr:serine/threonine-protein kinase RsbW [Solirubrobacterales bacterium]